MYHREAIEFIKDALIKNGETLSVAESVTSGHLQAAFSLADGATKFFQGGITAYNLDQKTRLLKVDPIHAIGCNCVSEKVAEQMALSVLALFSSDWALAITGYANPIPDAGITDLFCFVSIAFRGDIVVTEKIRSENGDPISVQIFYTNQVLGHFSRCLESRKRSAVAAN